MKYLLALRKARPLWFFSKLFFDSFKSVLVLLVTKPFDWKSFLQILYWFPRKPLTASITQNCQGEKKSYHLSNIWYFNSRNWIEQKQSMEVFNKKDVFKNFVNFTGKHQSSRLFLIELPAWMRICECRLFSDCMTSETKRTVWKNHQ